jgi:hypothetical protein
MDLAFGKRMRYIHDDSVKNPYGSLIEKELFLLLKFDRMWVLWHPPQNSGTNG